MVTAVPTDRSEATKVASNEELSVGIIILLLLLLLLLLMCVCVRASHAVRGCRAVNHSSVGGTSGG
jgi:hypothetical protein